MRFRAVLLAIFLAALLAYMSSNRAQNLLFLGDAPVEAMTEEDLELLLASAHRALGEKDDGDSLGWRNESTGAHGTITPGNSREERGQRCRTLQFEHEAGARRGRMHFDFCMQHDGTWKIVQ